MQSIMQKFCNHNQQSSTCYTSMHWLDAQGPEEEAVACGATLHDHWSSLIISACLCCELASMLIRYLQAITMMLSFKCNKLENDITGSGILGNLQGDLAGELRAPSWWKACLNCYKLQCDVLTQPEPLVSLNHWFRKRIRKNWRFFFKPLYIVWQVKARGLAH